MDGKCSFWGIAFSTFIFCLILMSSNSFSASFSSRITRQTQQISLSMAVVSDSDSSLSAPLGTFKRFLKKLGISIGNDSSEMKEMERKIPNNAVLVFGATGKTGSIVVESLLQRGRQVVAVTRKKDKAIDSLNNVLFNSNLFIQTGINISDPSAVVAADLFSGVSQVVCVTGPSADGTSATVDFEGTRNILNAAGPFLSMSSLTSPKEKMIFAFKKKEEVENFQRLDDVIMGGKSESSWKKHKKFATWTGKLIEEGGGFCGTRAKDLDVNLSEWDGIRIKVRGDGSRFKMNFKAPIFADRPESTYQATFETKAGEWAIIDIPLTSFVPVKMSNVQYEAPRLAELDPPMRKMIMLGLVYSRFEYNGRPNPAYKPGPFSLDVEFIKLYRNARPSFVYVSSAAVERNARLETKEARAKDIPIVQLNPGGILNWKYKAEELIRESGLGYTIIRPCGLLPEKLAKEQPVVKLQACQGDEISGRLSRQDLAEVIVFSLNSDTLLGKTFELRRDEAEDSLGVPTKMNTIFRSLVKDSNRVEQGLLPFPKVSDPPPPLTKEEINEILKAVPQQQLEGR